MTSSNSAPLYYQNILETIGNTPLVRLNHVATSVRCTVLAKLEFMNPGGSVKDRIGLRMIEAAEQEGRLKPGGTIVEATSGNTGVGLALAAALKGYKCVFVMPDKMSLEKVQLLRAFGARVVVTPTAVEPHDPRSYYSVSKRIVEETPNSILANQYHNPMNPESHYLTTGPEIWRQTGEQVKAFVTGMGTGGTISGTGRFLKEKNPNVKIIGVDPIGSLLYDTWRLGRVPDEPFLKTYKTEGIGEDFLPSATDMSVVDEIIQVSDKESMLMTRRLVREEGIFCGGSSGSAVAGLLKSPIVQAFAPNDLVVVILPDSGSRYLSKIFDDEWMREYGFLESTWGEARVADLLATKHARSLITASASDHVRDVVNLMKQHDISQMPVLTDGKLVGMISESTLLTQMSTPGSSADESIAAIINRQVTTIPTDMRLEAVMSLFGANHQAVIVAEADRVIGILTKIDLIDYLAARMK